MIKNDERSRYDVNIRSIIAFREIGRGLSHIETFHRIMNMSPPYSHSTFDDTVKDVLPHYIATRNESMTTAAANIKAQDTVPENTESDVLEDDAVLPLHDCDVSLDGSWHIRGYASLNGFAVFSFNAGDKVADIDVMTKDCRSCMYWKGKQEDPGYENWTMTHDCHINHEGSSGSMETEGAVRIFNRSINKYGLRYINYIGDLRASHMGTSQ